MCQSLEVPVRRRIWSRLETKSPPACCCRKAVRLTGINLAVLLKRGYLGGESLPSSTPVMLHIDRGGDNPPRAPGSTMPPRRGNGTPSAFPIIPTGTAHLDGHGRQCRRFEIALRHSGRYRRDRLPVHIIGKRFREKCIYSPDQLPPEYPATPSGQAANLRAVWTPPESRRLGEYSTGSRPGLR